MSWRQGWLITNIFFLLLLNGSSHFFSHFACTAVCLSPPVQGLHPVSVSLVLDGYSNCRSENMSPGCVHFVWHTQDVIHCILHCVLVPPLQLKLTLIMRDLLGKQQRLSVQTPQYVGLNFLVLIQLESASFSAFFAWNLGRHNFPFGTWGWNSHFICISQIVY